MKFLLETAAATWGMDNFHEYLDGSQFTVYKDLVPEPSLGTTQHKTLNRLQTAMSEHDFEIRDKQKSNLPDSLKTGQQKACQIPISKTEQFNKIIHVDTFSTVTTLEKIILTITDDFTAFSVSTIMPDNSTTTTVTALRDHWFKTYRYPDTISIKQGKVEVSKLQKKINDWAPLEQGVTCKSRNMTFNNEIQQQWEQNQQEISEEEFISTINFLHELQEPEQAQDWDNLNSGDHWITEDHLETDDTSEDEDEVEYDLDSSLHFGNDQMTYQPKRINISLCRHKLQRRLGCRSKNWRQLSGQLQPDWPTESGLAQQMELDLVDDDADSELVQLREMEKSLKLQRMELLRQGVPDTDDGNWDNLQWPEERKDGPVKEEDDSLENEDLAFITSVLESFSRHKSKATPSKPFYAIFSTPEGALAQTKASRRTPHKFNQNSTMTPQKFNQDLTSESSATGKFSCFPTIGEEGAGGFSDEEDTQSEIDPEEVEFETQSEIDTEDTEAETTFQGIYIISKERGKPFAAWQPYIPPEPVFRNLPAQSWWSVSSPPEYSSPEPTPPGSRRSTIQLRGTQPN
jgi:hypothetical protein